MLSKLTRIQLVAFVVIAIVAVSYGAINYLNLPRLLGIGKNALAIELPNGAGLYPNGIVTLRGVMIGQIDDVQLTDTGAVAHVKVRDDVPVPVDTAVEVRSTSAVGEQYINFEPRSPSGPNLENHSVIPSSAVTLPVPVARLLEKVDDLVVDVPSDKLTSTIDEIYAAMNGSAPHLQQLLDSGRALQDSADQALPDTLQLINDAEQVLATQVRTGDDVRSAVNDLADFTEQLQMSDPDLRGTLEKAPSFLDETGRLFDDLRGSLPALLTDLTQVGQVTTVYVPQIAQTLTILPSAINGPAGAAASSKVPGTARIDFDLVVNDPPSCTEGFETKRRPPTDTSPARPAKGAYCQVAPSDPQAVRGARNAPCPPSASVARAPTAAGCGLNFQTPQEDAEASEEAIRTQLDVAARNPQTVAETGRLPAGRTNTDPETQGVSQPLSQAPYDLATGVFMAPGQSQPMVNGDALPAGPKDWKSIFLNPLGVTAR